MLVVFGTGGHQGLLVVTAGGNETRTTRGPLGSLCMARGRQQRRRCRDAGPRNAHVFRVLKELRPDPTRG